MVNILKFSQFTEGDLATATNKLVGVSALSNGENIYTPFYNIWMTATRPAPPFEGMYGYNTDIASFESYNGTTWIPAGSGGTGSVTQVNTGTGLTGGPITTTGTISFAAIAANSFWANNTGSLAVPTVIPLSTFLQSANNLSDLTNTTSARMNLGLVIGSNVEAWSPILDQFAMVSLISNAVFSTNGSNVIQLSTTLPAGLTIPGYVTTAALANYLPLAGGTMSGAINMGMQQINNMANPSLSQDAATKDYVDSLFPTPAALTAANDTNITLTLGGTPTAALLQATSITAGWSGLLSGIRGGTGVNNGSNTATYAGNLNFANSFSTSGNFSVIQTYTGSTNVTFPTSGTLATTSQLPTPAALTKTDDTNITITLGGAPSTALLQAVSLTMGWNGLLSGTRGGTGVNNGTNTATYAGNLSFANSFTTSGNFSVIQTYTGSTNVTFPTSGTLATTSQIPTGAPLTKTDDTNVTLTLGGSPSTALVNAASLTLGWTGTLGTGRGGTGLGSYVLGDTIYASATNTLSALAGNTTTTKQFLTQTGTGTVSAAPAWGTISNSDIPGAALTKTDDTNVTLTLGGTPTTALLRAASLTLGWTGTLAIARGGLNSNSSPTTGTILRGNNTAWVPTTSTYPDTVPINSLLYAASANVIVGLSTANNGALVTGNTGTPSILAGPASTGNIFQSNSVTAPSWSTATYPSTAGTAGKVLISDGTNIVSSTPTFPNASATSGKLIQSDGTNWIASTTTYPATNAINTLLYASAANVIAALTTGNNGALITSSSGVPSILSPGALKAIGTNAAGIMSGRSVSFNLVQLSSGTYTPSTGLWGALVWLLGGGAAGGGTSATTSSQYCSASGGGAGELAIGYFSAATIGASLSITLGAGGTGVAGGTGNNGGTSSFGALMTALGGNGGKNTGASAATVQVDPGTGGTGGTGGQYRNPGANGFNGYSSAPLGFNYSGAGASSPYGAGGYQRIFSTSAGVNASGNGSGGGGAVAGPSQGAALAGGSGSGGLCLVLELLFT